MTEATGKFSITAKHEAPQAIVTIIPETNPELPAVEVAVPHLPLNVPVTSPFKADAVDNSHLYDVPPELPGAIAPDAVPLSAEEYDELKRLESRVCAEPTSERAKQELLSFKSLKGIV